MLGGEGRHAAASAIYLGSKKLLTLPDYFFLLFPYFYFFSQDKLEKGVVLSRVSRSIINF